MITVTCEKYPSLLIADLGVQLDSGIAHVSDPATVARFTPGRCQALSVLGVTVSNDDDTSDEETGQPATTPPEPTGDDDEDTEEIPAPAGNASTADWAAYAGRLGIEVPDGTGRDDIRALIDSIVGDDDGDDEDADADGAAE